MDGANGTDLVTGDRLPHDPQTRLRFGAALGSALGCLVATVPSSAFAAITSTFDNDAEGWLAVDLPWPDPGSPPRPLATYVPTHVDDGNGGGYVGISDPSSGPLFYWRAPAVYLGDRSDAYGRMLSYDIANTGVASFVDLEDVILVGAGLTLVYQTHEYPAQVFTHFSIGLGEAGWHVDTEEGAAATAEQMQQVLGSLTSLYIRGEYLDGTVEVGLIDNVVFDSDLPDDVIFICGFEY